MKEHFLSDFLTRGKVFSFSSSFFIVFAHGKIIASDGNIWVLGLPTLPFQKVPFCLMGSQHSPLRRIPSTWSTHLSQNSQWAMDGIPSSAAHHPHFLIASCWLSTEAKLDFAFRDARIEEGFFTHSLSPGCVLGSKCYKFWVVQKERHGQESCQQYRQARDSLSTYFRGRLPIPGFAVMEVQSWIQMLGLGWSADGMLFVWIMLAAIWCPHICFQCN